MGVNLLPDLIGDKPWSPDKWGPRHRLVVSMHLAGLRNKEIAETLDFSESRVSVILSDPRASLEIDDLSRAVADKTIDTMLRLKLYANEALSEIVDEMRNSTKEDIRQKAAFGILDRAGYSPAAVNAAGDMSNSFSEEFISRMEEALDESGEIDASYSILPSPGRELEEKEGRA